MKVMLLLVVVVVVVRCSQLYVGFFLLDLRQRLHALLVGS